MSTINFQLIYDGKALENHEISPRDLSVALVAINDLLEAADKIINNGKTRTEVRVKATFETGCFKINFSTIQSLLDHAKDLFNSDGAHSVINAGKIISLVFTGLHGLLKFLKGKKPTKIIENTDKSFTVYLDGEQIIVEKKVLELYRNWKLRKDFEALLDPLKKEGIDDCAITTSDIENFTFHIKKDEVNFFACQKAEEVQIEEPQHFETNISIINLSFKEGNKWFVNDGGESFYATVEDKNFLSQVNDSTIKFAKGDILKVKIRRVQYYNIDEKKLKSEHFIEMVLRHTTPSYTMNLLGDN